MSQVQSLPPQPMAKKQHALDAVQRAVTEARAQGIEIVRVPMFDWTDLEEDRPRACDATGAVLIEMGYGAASFTHGLTTTVYGSGNVRPKDWPLLVQNHLGVGVFWLHCFWMGWSYNNQIQVAVLDDKGKHVGWRDDEVSKAAIRMAKKLVR